MDGRAVFGALVRFFLRQIAMKSYGDKVASWINWALKVFTVFNIVAAASMHIRRTVMIKIFKISSCVGMIAATAWFFIVPDFAAVLLGILSLTVFMMTLLPVAADSKLEAK